MTGKVSNRITIKKRILTISKVRSTLPASLGARFRLIRDPEHFQTWPQPIWKLPGSVILVHKVWPLHVNSTVSKGKPHASDGNLNILKQLDECYASITTLFQFPENIYSNTALKWNLENMCSYTLKKNN